MKYVFIENHRAEFSIKAMCRVLRVARSGWYVWLRRRHQMSLRQQFRLTCDAAVHKAFFEAKQLYGAPRLADELPEFNIKTIAASLRRQGLRAKASRKFSVHMACPYWRICWSRTSAPAARTRSGRVTSRTCVPMRAGCISQ